MSLRVGRCTSLNSSYWPAFTLIGSSSSGSIFDFSAQPNLSLCFTLCLALYHHSGGPARLFLLSHRCITQAGIASYTVALLVGFYVNDGFRALQYFYFLISPQFLSICSSSSIGPYPLAGFTSYHMSLCYNWVLQPCRVKRGRE